MISAKEIGDAFHTFFTDFYGNLKDIKFLARMGLITLIMIYLLGHIVKEDAFMGTLMIEDKVDIDKYMNPQDVNDGKEHVVTSQLTRKFPIFIEEAT